MHSVTPRPSAPDAAPSGPADSLPFGSDIGLDVGTDLDSDLDSDLGTNLAVAAAGVSLVAGSDSTLPLDPASSLSNASAVKLPGASLGPAPYSLGLSNSSSRETFVETAEVDGGVALERFVNVFVARVQRLAAVVFRTPNSLVSTRTLVPASVSTRQCPHAVRGFGLAPLVPHHTGGGTRWGFGFRRRALRHAPTITGSQTACSKLGGDR